MEPRSFNFRSLKIQFNVIPSSMTLDPTGNCSNKITRGDTSGRSESIFETNRESRRKTVVDSKGSDDTLRIYCLSGLRPSSGILKTRQQNVSETGICFRPLFGHLKKGKVKLSLYQAMEAHRVVRRRGSHSI
jgi:hypothetical protein